MKFLLALNEFSEDTQLDIIRTTSNEKVTTFFSKSPNPKKRAAVASNPKTPIGVLDELVFDSSYEVLYKLVKNPSLKGVSLDRLSDITYDLGVETGIARHSNTEKETLQKIIIRSNHIKSKVIAEERLKRKENT